TAIKAAQAGAEAAQREAARKLRIAEFARELESSGPLSSIITDADKQLAEQRLSILDKLHSAGLLSEEKYWDDRIALAQEKSAAEIKAITDQLGVVGTRIEAHEQGLLPLTADELNKLTTQHRLLAAARERAFQAGSVETVGGRIQQEQ